jgi:hypothetical protein
VQVRGKGRVALLGQLLPDAAIVVVDEQPDGPYMVLESYAHFWCMEGKEGRAYPAG